MLQDLDIALKSVSQSYLNDFKSKIRLKKGIEGLNYKLRLLSSSTERLAKAVVNKSIDFIREHKINDTATINRVVNLNQKYIGEFNNVLKLQ